MYAIPIPSNTSYIRYPFSVDLTDNFAGLKTNLKISSRYIMYFAIREFLHFTPEKQLNESRCDFFGHVLPS
jgi:hypothetical protein